MSHTVTELQQALTKAQQIYAEVSPTATSLHIHTIHTYPCDTCNGTGEIYYKTSRQTPWVEDGPFTCKECGGSGVVVVVCDDDNDEEENGR